ncbi:MAG: CoA transferase [Chloroflexi bacterium]|nr:CoA transferase [Chloroflexota bacterium]
MASALDGIRVIDFGQYIAGPLTGMLLADQGADVVKVDPPGGPIWDTPANATWNRGKRSILLDLKRAEDLKIAKELSRRADVVVENFRPGVMDRLGLGAEVLMADNPALIYCSMPGFASDDPRASIASWEGVIAAAAGTYRPSPTGSDPDRPVYTAIPIASCYAAFLSAVSITMGLIARVRDGIGQRIEVPLFDAMFVAMGARALTTHDRPAATPVPTVGTWTRQYQCKDGRWVQYHAGNLNFRAFLDAVRATSWEVEELSSEEQQQRVTELFSRRTALE